MRPLTRIALLLLAGAVTALGYLGKPWWAAWPAAVTLRGLERTLNLPDRGPAWQIAALCAAILVNIAVLTAILHLIAAGLRGNRRAV